MKDINAIKTYLKVSPESKPYLSCKEQIILLKDRGLIIDDEKSKRVMESNITNRTKM
ncbi:hypothetical protein OSX66_12790 [Staphylococcus agnetis]|uniref:hypothetical protein n=1 Tax=Staphylococcus agnetis TaxID=985762 RepID=UPI002418304F|nr:hypothetical protein [Staphylococcus agnetis]MDG4944728.1 hypothetical protein [Staphylococcus agnetis]